MITDIKVAEELVSKHPELSWDGWNITWIYENPDGYMDKRGIFNEGKWCIKEVYAYENNGWNIPNKVLKRHNV